VTIIYNYLIFGGDWRVGCVVRPRFTVGLFLTFLVPTTLIAQQRSSTFMKREIENRGQEDNTQ